jgi:hypothetical protein
MTDFSNLLQNGGLVRDILEAGLPGWRSSADDPLLRPFSLLTGNFEKLQLRERQRL